MKNIGSLYSEDQDNTGWAVFDEELQKRFGKVPLSGSWWKELPQNPFFTNKTVSTGMLGDYPYAANMQKSVPDMYVGGRTAFPLDSGKNSYFAQTKVMPDTLTSFSDGMKQYGKRWLNDMSYNWGRAQSWMNDEQLLKQGFSSILPEWEHLKTLNRSEWGDMLKNLERDYTLLKNSQGEYRAELLKGQMLAMKKIEEMRENAYSPEQIEAEIKKWSENGGSGTQRMRDALREEDREIKPTKGWATAGEFTAGIAQQMVPLAAGMVIPPAAPALMALNLGSLAGQEYAQAHKTIDRYEEKYDVKVSEGERLSYVLFSTGLDFILERMMQGRYLSNVTAPVKRALTDQVIEQLRYNPRARREMSDLVKRYASSLNAGSAKGFAKDVALEGATESLSSIGRDVAEVLYNRQDEFPELSYIFNNALSAGMEGLGVGGVLGGSSRAGQRWVNNNRRKFKGLVSIGEWNGQPVEVTGSDDMGMIEIMLSDGSKKSVAIPEVRNIRTVDYDVFNGGVNVESPQNIPYAIDSQKENRTNRKMVLYQKDMDAFLDALEEGAFDSPGYTSTPEERRKKRKEFQAIMEKEFIVKQGNFTDDKDLFDLDHEPVQQQGVRNPKYSVRDLREHAQNFLKKMNFDMEIYDTINDVPIEERRKMMKNVKYAGFYSSKSGRAAMILENIKDPADIENTILHEKMGHEGMRAILGDKVNQFYQDLFYSMPSNEQTNYLRMYGSQELAAEEYLAEVLTVLHPDPTFWDAAKANIRDAIRKRLGHDIRFSDADLRYLLWKSKNRVQAGDDLESMMKKGRKNSLLQNLFFPDKDNFPHIRE